MSKALQVISALCKNKDIGVVLATSHINELFDGSGHEDIWEFIKNYYGEFSGVPDFSVVSGKFNVSEPAIGASTEFYIDELRNERIATRMESIMATADNKLNEMSPAQVLARMQTELSKLNVYSSKANDSNMMDFEDAETHYKEVRRKAEEMGGTPGIPTGISFIDSAYPSGMCAGDLIVCLGYTARMKSYVTTLLACNVHDSGFTPMIASLEMSAEKIRDRIYTIMGGGTFRNSDLSNGYIDFDSFDRFKIQKENKPDFIIVTNTGSDNLTPNMVEAKIDQHKPKFVIIDYAQLASDNANSDGMRDKMMNMANEYKRLAMRKQVVILLISSATADGSSSVANGAPTVEQVAWSKQLAYNADLAFAVHRHDGGNMVEIVGRKNRNGPLFAGFLDWDVDNGIIKEVTL